MLVSFNSSAWEIITYNTDDVLQFAEIHPKFEVKLLHFGDNDKGCFDIHINPWIKDTSVGNNNESSTDNTSYPTWMYVPTYKESSMWKVCDTIPSKNRWHLETTEGAYIEDQCESLVHFHEEDISQHDYLDMLMNLSKSAVACAITAIICVLGAVCVGLFAVARQQIVFAMITGVCFLPSSLYTSFAVVLILLRRTEMELDTRDLPPFLSSARDISNGWSMYTAWLAFLLCGITGSTWIILFKELQKTRANYMYNSKYDQICSMQ